MPKRTNTFQQLITRVQVALHNSRASVQESAMVPNYSSNIDTEIDILITFEVGGLPYRTGIECRDHSRPAGPDWIQQLRTKRDDCRLDKIVAVHASGFTKSAIKEAETHGIQVATIKQLDEVDWAEAVLPYQHIMVDSVQVNIAENGMSAAMESANHESYDRLQSVLRLPTGLIIDTKRLRGHVRADITQQFLTLVTKQGAVSTLPSPFRATRQVEFNCPLPRDSRLVHVDSTETPIYALMGRATVEIDVAYLDLKRYLFYEKQSVFDAQVKVLGHDITVTMASDKREEFGIMVDIPGAKIEKSEDIPPIPLPVWIKVLS